VVGVEEFPSSRALRASHGKECLHFADSHSNPSLRGVDSAPLGRDEAAPSGSASSAGARAPGDTRSYGTQPTRSGDTFRRRRSHSPSPPGGTPAGGEAARGPRCECALTGTGGAAAATDDGRCATGQPSGAFAHPGAARWGRKQAAQKAGQRRRRVRAAAGQPPRFGPNSAA
jgi:hypothetical protein